MTAIATIQRKMSERFDLQPEQLDPAQRLDQLGLDSLSMIEFMFALEDEFHIKLPDERVPIHTIQDIANIVDQLLAPKQ